MSWNDRIFDGFVGHVVGAMIVAGVLGSVYAFFQGGPKSVTKQVCMQAVDELRGSAPADASIWIRKVKEGTGGAEPGQPLWESDIEMKPSGKPGEVCASLTFPERGGVQFKVHVNYKSIAEIPDISEREKLLKARKELLAAKYLCTNMLSDEAAVAKSFKAEDCITYNKFTGNLWILLDQYAVIRTGGEFWNNWLTSDAAVP